MDYARPPASEHIQRGNELVVESDLRGGIRDEVRGMRLVLTLGVDRIPERDAVSSGDDDILGELLSQMDGAKDNEGIFVVASTNRKDVLDEEGN